MYTAKGLLASIYISVVTRFGDIDHLLWMRPEFNATRRPLLATISKGFGREVTLTSRSRIRLLCR